MIYEKRCVTCHGLTIFPPDVFFHIVYVEMHHLSFSILSIFIYYMIVKMWNVVFFFIAPSHIDYLSCRQNYCPPYIIIIFLVLTRMKFFGTTYIYCTYICMPKPNSEIVCLQDISKSEDYYFNKKNIKRMPYVYAQIA